ncbi:hypothetical protein HDV05_000233 [Chytridiales sp. JEL 0842]|nr:hypothetical protein HDV05_000233 [Chytridiales sp. JEL 0842]
MDLTARLNGQLDVVVFLHEHRSEGTLDVMDRACVEWGAREEGCTARVLDNAARKCHLDVVKPWLVAENKGGGSGVEHALDAGS